MKNISMKSRLVGAVLLTGFSLSITLSVPAAESAALMEPVKSVYVDYLKIQGALAKDSLSGVPDNAQAIVKHATADTMKMLPAEVAQCEEKSWVWPSGNCWFDQKQSRVD